MRFIGTLIEWRTNPLDLSNVEPSQHKRKHVLSFSIPEIHDAVNENQYMTQSKFPYALTLCAFLRG